MTVFTNLTPADQERIRIELLHTQGAPVPAKLIQTLEADIYARELLGLNVARQKAKLAALRAPRRP